jgi:hypothetical protein
MVDREALGGVRHTVIERIAAGNIFRIGERPLMLTIYRERGNWAC